MLLVEFYFTPVGRRTRFLKLKGIKMKAEIERTEKQTKYNNENNKLLRRGNMKYFSIILTVMVAALIGRSSEDLTGWEFDQSTQQSFYLLEDVAIDGFTVEGDGTGSGDGTCDYYSDDNSNGVVDQGEWHSTGECDVIGAFRVGVCSNPAYQGSQLLCESLGEDWNTDEEICIGWRYADASGNTTVPLMGKEGSEENGEYPNTFYYANPGESAYLKIYDASNGSILDLTPGSELPGWELNSIFTIAGTSTAGNAFGCTDSDACNHNADATADDGSCLFNDCAGECGGSAEVDDCGVCNGGNADDLGCGCFQPGPSGCDNACGSNLAIDECGVCGGSDYNCEDAG